MLETFKIMFTGDHLDEAGYAAPESLGLDLLDAVPHVRYGFLRDLGPVAGDPTYWERLYSLEVEPKHLTGANGIILRRPWVRTSTFAEGAQDLIAIGRAGVGYDKINLDACTANDVVVFNAPESLTHSTASAALLLMLALARHLPEHQRAVRDGRWDRQKDLVGDDLTGQTLGIVGLGRTGMELARLVGPFGMRILAYSPHANLAHAAALGIELTSLLDTVLREADFVSLHCRLTEQNRHMIGERELALMKPASYFVNVARGELVDQAALARCLRARRIAGAGLDVFENEPLPVTDPLVALDNVILTPHWLPSTHQAGRILAVSVVEDMLRVARGQVPAHVLNPMVLERARFRERLTRFTVNAI